MRLKDVVLVPVGADRNITGIVVARKLFNTMRVVEALEGHQDLLDRLMIPHSNMIMTQQGFYLASYDSTTPGEAYTIRRM